MKKENINSRISKLIKENFQSRLKEKDEEETNDEEIKIDDLETETNPEGEDSFEAPEGGVGDEFGGGDEISGDTKEVQDHLQAALEAARTMGDEKLVDQIGNTITFFTRTHIVKEAYHGEEGDDDFTYIHDNLEQFIPKITEIRDDLMQLNRGMEESGPVDEDLMDAFESCNKVIDKVGLREDTTYVNTPEDNIYNDSIAAQREKDEETKEPLDESIKHFTKYAGLNKNK